MSAARDEVAASVAHGTAILWLGSQREPSLALVARSGQSCAGMQNSEFLGRVKDLGPFEDDSQVQAAVDATLEAIGRLLVSDERRLLLQTLPAALGAVVEKANRQPTLSPHELFAGIARHEGVRLGFAREHEQVVCRALSEILPDETVNRLQRHLPILGELFAAPERISSAESVERSGHVRPLDTTLAAGRPGSRHPLSEARAERAQAQSVVLSDDPHADTKLSSARGLTQEREHETLADGKPPGSR
jgi:uncharacterized protein (DUF2267 family)